MTNAALLQVRAELEQAAHVCGANRLRAIWRVLVPLITSSLLFVGILNALLVFKEVSMALMLTTPEKQILSVRIWALWDSGKAAEAAALGICMIAVAAGFILIAQRATGFRLDEIRAR